MRMFPALNRLARSGTRPSGSTGPALTIQTLLPIASGSFRPVGLRGAASLLAEDPEQAADLVVDLGRLADDQRGGRRPGDDRADGPLGLGQPPLPPQLHGAPQAGLVRGAELAGAGRRRVGRGRQQDDGQRRAQATDAAHGILRAVTGVSVTGLSRPESRTGQPEASNGW